MKTIEPPTGTRTMAGEKLLSAIDTSTVPVGVTSDLPQPPSAKATHSEPTVYFVDLPMMHRRLNHECLVRHFEARPWPVTSSDLERLPEFHAKGARLVYEQPRPS